MLPILIALVTLIVETALVTFVALHASDHRPGKIFIVFSILVIVTVCATVLRELVTDPRVAYWLLTIIYILVVGCYSGILLLLISSLFVPEWWQGPDLIRRPITWISLPYFSVGASIALDLFGQLNWVIEDLVFRAGVYQFTFTRTGMAVMAVLAVSGQLVLLIVLGVAFFKPQYRMFRLPILLVGLAIIFSLIVGGLTSRLGPFARIVAILMMLPIITALAYMVLGTRLFLTSRATLDLALHSLREAIAVADVHGVVNFANPSAQRLGIQVGSRLGVQLGGSQGETIFEELLKGDGTELALIANGRNLELTIVPVYDRRQRRHGTLALVRDVSDIARYSALLERERSQLAATVAALEHAQRQQASLAATVRALSLPLIPVLPGVLVLPLIGTFAEDRIQEFITTLLNGIERQRANTVILDLTGIAELDLAGAHGLLRGIRAARLLGARCVLAGIRPAIAQPLVDSGLTLTEVMTAATLEQAVAIQIPTISAQSRPAA